MSVRDFIAECQQRDAYLGKHAYQLMAETSEQMELVYADRGLSFPIEVSSVLHFILENEGASLADIARGLRLQHQLVAQRVRKLDALGMVEREPDPTDARRFHLMLTVEGRAQAQALVECMEDTAKVYQKLFEEIDCNLTEAIAKALKAIRSRPLPDRFVDSPVEMERG